jgi:poly(3-hydroxybutyrate) depolymerase
VLYHLYEYNRALLESTAELAQAGARLFSAPTSWLAWLPGANRVAAGYELLYRLGKTYGKPAFGIEEVEAHGARVPVVEETALDKPFCRLQRFKRYSDQTDVVARFKDDPVVLVVAPLSGHHSTLLRDTVRSLLSAHDVYITDWTDARDIPADLGPFNLADYVGYIREFIQHIGARRVHVVAVCQPAVPVLAATALMAAAGEPLPRSLTLMGGSIDARRSPTQVNEFASRKSLQWFEHNLLHNVPAPYSGRGRRVYPGFLQHAGFMALNPVRHMRSHQDFFQHLVEGDLASADEHRRFYDEYNAVLDMPGEYYMDCIRVVFKEHLLPLGRWHIAGERVAPEKIAETALLTIEGELDDISGIGQTHAAHDLCAGIPDSRKRHITIAKTGHYGIFSGRRWREIVYPQVRDFIAAAQATRQPD